MIVRGKPVLMHVTEPGLLKGAYNTLYPLKYGKSFPLRQKPVENHLISSSLVLFSSSFSLDYSS